MASLPYLPSPHRREKTGQVGGLAGHSPGGGEEGEREGGREGERKGGSEGRWRGKEREGGRTDGGRMEVMQPPLYAEG